MIDGFHTDTSAVIWVTLAFALGSTAPLLTLGWVADTFGRKRMYLWGVLIVALGLALSAASQNIAQLIVIRIFYAFGHQHIGWTLGAVTGKVIMELVQGREPNIDISAFSPNRFS